ncbi:hypothetical protein AB4156_11855 [Cupriavidus sp. 2MCAB6]|uniref:pyroglutamyl-peptidase I family protein n=1 Tax=Cupriavidus sp. 2MCAB6 TaxID=3232981 RepID=UPI003F8EDEBC
MSVLVTGFQPFGADSINASWEVARALDGVCIGNARSVARIPDNAATSPSTGFSTLPIERMAAALPPGSHAAIGYGALH